jgi:hypothetical protein
MHEEPSGVRIMAYTTIDDPSAHFQTALYTGNGGSSTQVVTNDGNSDLQPDWIWLKNRTSARWNLLNDSTRGASYNLYSNETDAEDVGGSGGNTSITSFNSDGFTLATDTGDGGWNEQGDSHVAWQWKANGGSRTTFTESGNNPGGGRQVNTTAGFSILDYTGTGTAGTVAHGLGAVPHVMIFKRRNSAADWAVYHHKNTSEPATDFLKLNESDATQDVASVFNDTEPTSSVFTVHEAGKVNTDGDTFISYCFTEKQGYSKFGSYTGNGNADGPMVFCGFKPAWVMIKHTGASEVWRIFDSTRDTHNAMEKDLFPNLNNAEGSGTARLDFLSNGFKIRDSGNALNDSGGNLIYMAFAESPFVSSEGVPTTAR